MLSESFKEKLTISLILINSQGQGGKLGVILSLLKETRPLLVYA